MKPTLGRTPKSSTAAREASHNGLQASQGEGTWEKGQTLRPRSPTTVFSKVLKYIQAKTLPERLPGILSLLRQLGSEGREAQDFLEAVLNSLIRWGTAHSDFRFILGME